MGVVVLHNKTEKKQRSLPRFPPPEPERDKPKQGPTTVKAIIQARLEGLEKAREEERKTQLNALRDKMNEYPEARSLTGSSRLEDAIWDVAFAKVVSVSLSNEEGKTVQVEMMAGGQGTWVKTAFQPTAEVKHQAITLSTKSSGMFSLIPVRNREEAQQVVERLADYGPVFKRAEHPRVGTTLYLPHGEMDKNSKLFFTCKGWQINGQNPQAEGKLEEVKPGPNDVGMTNFVWVLREREGFAAGVVLTK